MDVDDPDVEEDPEEEVEGEEEIDDPDGNTAIVEVDYDGGWSGNVGNTATTSSVDGEGSESFEIELTDGFDVVTGVFQKQDDSDDELSARIIVDGDVVVEESTTAAYGLVTVTVSVT